MLPQVQKCIQVQDIKGLRYIFLDSLDVDPTFEKYKEDYEVCKKIKGFFEGWRELTPLSQDKGTWNMSYWEQLKIDLTKNFSEERFKHMMEVAKIVYQSKLSRLLEERKVRQSLSKQSEVSTLKMSEDSVIKKPELEPVNKFASMPKEKEKTESYENSRESSKLQNQYKNEEKPTPPVVNIQSREDQREDLSKKWKGIAILIFIVMIFLWLFFRNRNPLQ